jgi:hypothetical protein
MLSLGDIFRTLKAHGADKFELIEMAYWWLFEHHQGQYSQPYRDMCRLEQSYSPGAMRNKPHRHDLFDLLCEEACCEHLER